MTGKELIIYILQNNLENEVVLENGVFTGFMTESEAAVKFKVGIPTIRVWYDLGYLAGMKRNGFILLFKNVKDPRLEHKTLEVTNEKRRV